MEFGIFAPFGEDHDRNLAFCHDTDVHYVILSAAQLTTGEEDVPTPDTLASVKDKYDDGGVTLTALTPPRITFEGLADESVRARELDVFRRLVTNMGEAGIRLLHLYVSGVQAPEDPEERELYWQRLVAYYQELVATAEKAEVKLSTHHFHRSDHLVWNYETMSRLLKEAPSPYNGVTFCFGKSEMAGDDLAADIRSYGDKIFMVHIRDVQTRVGEGASMEVQKRLADIGYLEVAFGTGEVNMVHAVKALKEVGYAGQIYPEHYPSIAGDHAAGLAWCVGYFRALDQVVSP